MEKKIQIKEIKLPKKGILNLTKITSIKREGKSSIFSRKMKKNLTSYLYDFLYYKELLNISHTNIFLHNCLSDYEMHSWAVEIRNIIDIFNLDVKNIKEEVGNSLLACIKKNRFYKMLNCQGNYVHINQEGINIISLVYDDEDMKSQLNKLNNKINNNVNIIFNNSLHSFDSFESIKDGRMNEMYHRDWNTPWKTIQSNNSYNKNNIIFLEDKSPLDFGFSFNNVIKGNYKFYLHHYIINMKNAKLIMNITINNVLVYTIENFPNSKILEQFDNNNNLFSNDFNEIMSEFNDEDFICNEKKDIDLKETFICNITEEMFEKALNNSKKVFEAKTTFESQGSTESSTSKSSDKNYDLNIDRRIKKYTIRVRFMNQHLFWKAGWYLDGGKLVKGI